MQLSIKHYSELSKSELHDILQLRSAVFVVEQDCVYQDIDGKDGIAWHVLGKKDNQLVAYARIFAPGDYFEHHAIGRVVVKKTYRKQGLASVLMKAAINVIAQKHEKHIIELSAQTYLIEFYEGLGFESIGESYLEDGIPHIKMAFKS